MILEDLGHAHISLVDALTGHDPEDAKAALKRYTIQMARLHGLAYQNLAEYNLIFKPLESLVPTET